MTVGAKFTLMALMCHFSFTLCLSSVVFSFIVHYYYSLTFVFVCLFQPFDVQGGPKNRTCLSIDNSAVASGKKTCDMSKVSKCCKE